MSILLYNIVSNIQNSTTYSIKSTHCNECSKKARKVFIHEQHYRTDKTTNIIIVNNNTIN